MEIINAEKKDRDFIAKLESKTLGFFKALELAEQLLEDEKENVFLAKENELLGYISLRIEGDKGEISFLSVSKENRGEGIGKKLVSYVIESAKSKNLKFIFLEVAPSNIIATKFYLDLGFVATEKVIKEFNNKLVSKMRMEKKL